jgi:hypothetical protein
MIERVAAKAHNAIQVTDELGVTRPLKLLNFLSSGTRLARLDGQAVADPIAGYLPGMILIFPNNDTYIISRVTEDYYQDSLIRVVLELVLCNNNVTITRQVAQLNSQGGVIGHVDTAIYTTVPCKVIPLSQATDKLDDVLLQTYTVIFPSSKPVEINDKLQFATNYKPAKIEGIKSTTEGVNELTFDRDLRW